MFVSVGSDVSGFTSGMDTVQSRIQDVSRSMLGAGAGLTGLAAPLIGAAKSGVVQATAYESNMNILRAVSGATAEDMLALGELAKAMGEDLTLPGTSASDAAEAMVELAKAGLSVEGIMGATKGVLQMSAAGQISNARAAEIAANAVNAFNLEGDRAIFVADLLAAAANASSGEVEDMADALQMSSAVYAMAGVAIEDLVAAISLMSNAGIQGSDAGTSLKQMMLSLVNPTDKAAKSLAEMGINLFDAEGNLVGLADMISQFQDALAGMAQEQQMSTLGIIFGSDAIRAANVILAGGVDKFEAMKEAVTTEGAAADLAAVQMEGLSGAVEGLTSQIETALLDVLEPFLGILEKGVESVTGLVSAFIALDEPTKSAILAFAGVVSAAGPLLLLLGAIGTALSVILSPIGLVVVGLGALAAAFASDFMGIRGAVESAWSSVQPTLESVQEELGSVVGEIAQAYETEGFSGAAEVLGERIGGYIASGIQYVQDNIDVWAADIGSVVTDLISKGMTAIAEADLGMLTTNLATGIAAMFSSAFEFVVTSWETYGPVIATSLGTLLGTIFGKGIVLATQTIPSVIGDLAEAVMGLFSAGEGGMESQAEGVASNLADWFTANIPRVATGMAGVATSLLSGFYAAFKDNAPEWMGDVADTMLADLSAGIGALIENPIGIFIQIGSNIVDGIIVGIKAAGQSLADTILGIILSGIPGPIKKALGISSPSTVMMGLGMDAMAGLQAGLERGGMMLDVPIPSIEAPDVATTRLFDRQMTGADGNGYRSLGRQAMQLFAEGLAQEAQTSDLLSILAQAIHPALARTAALQRTRFAAA